MRNIISGSLDRFKTDTSYSPCSSIEQNEISGSFSVGSEHLFSYGRVSSIIEVRDEDNNLIDPSAYVLKTQYFGNYIRFKETLTPTRVSVRFNNGWTQAELPQDLKMGLLSWCATRYNYREEFVLSSQSQVDGGYAAMILKYAPISIG